MPLPCFGLRRPPTTARRTRASGASSTPRRAASVQRRCPSSSRRPHGAGCHCFRPSRRPSSRRKPGRGPGVFADAIRNVARQSCATVADQLSLVLDASGYRQMLRDSRAETTEGRLDNVQELIQLAGQFHSARELLDHAALSTGGPHDDTANTVKLLTLHRAKGLEFGHVFLPAWENGVFPPAYGDHAEERRLAYVGVTRA